MNGHEAQHIRTLASDDDLEDIAEQQLPEADCGEECEDLPAAAAGEVDNGDDEQRCGHDHRAAELSDPFHRLSRRGACIPGAPCGHRPIRSGQSRMVVDHVEQHTDEDGDHEQDDNAGCQQEASGSPSIHSLAEKSVDTWMTA